MSKDEQYKKMVEGAYQALKAQDVLTEAIEAYVHGLLLVLCGEASSFEQDTVAVQIAELLEHKQLTKEMLPGDVFGPLKRSGLGFVKMGETGAQYLDAAMLARQLVPEIKTKFLGPKRLDILRAFLLGLASSELQEAKDIHAPLIDKETQPLLENKWLSFGSKKGQINDGFVKRILRDGSARLGLNFILNKQYGFVQYPVEPLINKSVDWLQKKGLTPRVINLLKESLLQLAELEDNVVVPVEYLPFSTNPEQWEGYRLKSTLNGGELSVKNFNLIFYVLIKSRPDLVDYEDDLKGPYIDAAALAQVTQIQILKMAATLQVRERTVAEACESVREFFEKYEQQQGK